VDQLLDNKEGITLSDFEKAYGTITFGTEENYEVPHELNDSSSDSSSDDEDKDLTSMVDEESGSSSKGTSNKDNESEMSMSQKGSNLFGLNGSKLTTPSRIG